MLFNNPEICSRIVILKSARSGSSRNACLSEFNNAGNFVDPFAAGDLVRVSWQERKNE